MTWELRPDLATTDFFMPIVDDPFDFGRIAATNAISDVYTRGGSPIIALAILGVPLGKIATDTVCTIMQGGASVCASADSRLPPHQTMAKPHSPRSASSAVTRSK